VKLSKHYRFETLAVHAGHEVDSATGALVAPIHLSTTFERKIDGSYPHGFIYSRSDNPNRNGFEAALAALEGGAVSAAFSSGLAAVTAIMSSRPPTSITARRTCSNSCSPGGSSTRHSSI